LAPDRSVIQGLLTALDTLGSQAYGHGNLARVGVLLQRGLIVVGCAAVAIIALWWFTEPLLVLLRQPHDVAKVGARVCVGCPGG
jgi:MATE family multidrug resistance protein